MERIQEKNPNTPEFWNERYRDGASRENLWIRNAIENYIPEEGSRILEFGCGDGRMIQDLALKYPNRSWHGVDFSPIGIQKAIKKGIGGFICQDVHKYAENGGYDLVYSIQTLEHVDNPKLVIENMLKACRGGGYVLVTVPKPYSSSDNCGEHINRIYAKDLQEWLGPGSEVIEMMQGTKLVGILQKDSYITAAKYTACIIIPTDDEEVRKVAIWPEPVHSVTGFSRIVPFEIWYGGKIKKINVFDKYDVIVVVANVLRTGEILEKLYKAYPGKKIGIRNDSSLLSLFKVDHRQWPIYNFIQSVKKAHFLFLDRPDAERFWGAYFPQLKNKSYFISLPIDLEDYQKYHCKPNENKVFIIGDHLCTSAAALVNEVHPEAQPHIVRYRLGHSERQIVQFPLRSTFYNSGNQSHYLNIAKGSKYAVYFDTWGSVGRASRDMAALGIPCIGHQCIGYQEQLFPTLTIKRWEDLNEVSGNINQLRNDAEYYKYVQDVAMSEIRKYDIEFIKKRWYETIDAVMS